MDERNVNPFEPLVEAIAEAILKRASLNDSRTPADQLLTAEQAAGLLAVSPDWLYRHAKKLPFTRKLGPKMLRFSHEGILKWLATRRPAN